MQVIIKPMGLFVIGSLYAVLIFLLVRQPVFSQNLPFVKHLPSNLSTERLYLYDNDIQEGWTPQFSWNKDVQLKNGEYTASGENAIRLKMHPWEGIRFTHENIDVSPFDRLVFRVHPGKNRLLSLQVHGGVGSTDNPPKTWVLVGPLTNGQWTTCTIPLYSLDLARRKDVNCITIQDGTGSETEPIYIDDVYLLRKSAPDPEGTTTTTAISVEKEKSGTTVSPAPTLIPTSTPIPTSSASATPTSSPTSSPTPNSPATAPGGTADATKI